MEQKRDQNVATGQVAGFPEIILQHCKNQLSESEKEKLEVCAAAFVQLLINQAFQCDKCNIGRLDPNEPVPIIHSKRNNLRVDTDRDTIYFRQTIRNKKNKITSHHYVSEKMSNLHQYIDIFLSCLKAYRDDNLLQQYKSCLQQALQKIDSMQKEKEESSSDECDCDEC